MSFSLFISGVVVGGKFVVVGIDFGIMWVFVIGEDNIFVCINFGFMLDIVVCFGFFWKVWVIFMKL